jgi:ribonuclease HII
MRDIANTRDTSGNPTLDYENELWHKGFVKVAGVDEAGRGSLVGGVVAAAVVLPQGSFIDGVRDSKALSANRREALYKVITHTALAWGIGIVDEVMIDKINILQATRLAMKLAVEDLDTGADHLLVDAETIPVSIPQTRLIHGDAISHSISCASIIAKVTRDRMCRLWHEEFPNYGILANKGYCTRGHLQALLAYGPCPIHRKSFTRKLLLKHSNPTLDLGM